MTWTCDWSDAVVDCLLGTPSPNGAVSAAAAAWMTLGRARSAAVILFTSSTECVIAHADRDSSGGINVVVTDHRESLSALFDSDGLSDILELNAASAALQTVVLRDRLAACVVESVAPDRLTATTTAVAAILGNAQTQSSIVPTADHMESMAEFAAGAGHEINNPLGSIIGQTQLLLKQEDHTDRRQALGTIGAQAWRIRDMIGDCMLFARPPQPEFHELEIGKLVRQAAEKAVLALEHGTNCLNLDMPAMPLVVSVDATQIRTLVTHLVRNSLEACLNASGEPQLTVRLQPDRHAIVLTVEDNGPGIQDEKLRCHLFDPFFSGRQAGRGIGFGLPVCWQIVRTHDGVILVETDRDFRVVTALPRSRALQAG